ncbi:hypothetical protein VULLAG_LOCUS23190 [Vulpes lagopus]
MEPQAQVSSAEEDVAWDENTTLWDVAPVKRTHRRPPSSEGRSETLVYSRDDHQVAEGPQREARNATWGEWATMGEREFTMIEVFKQRLNFHLVEEGSFFLGVKSHWDLASLSFLVRGMEPAHSHRGVHVCRFGSGLLPPPRWRYCR